MNQNVDLTISKSNRMTLSVRWGAEMLDRALLIAAMAALLLTMASLFGRAYWLLELLTHFRMHFAIGSILLLLAALLRRRYRTAILASLVAATNMGPMVPYIMPGLDEAEAGQFHVRIMSANVSYNNSDYAALREAIEQENPDIVGLLEVNQTWVDEMSSFRTEYPYTVLRPEDGAYGLALFSRIPVLELETSPYIQDGFQTAIEVELNLDGVPVTMMLAHVRAPTTAGKADLRNRQLVKMADMIETDRNEEQILIGDLNITPWSPYYRTLETDANLVNAARGRGYRPTWPTGFGFLKIPIDHCLLSDGFRVRQFRSSMDFGSDHLPIVVDLAFAEPGATGSL